MTTKADYTEDEWAGLVRAPILAGAYVAASDMSFFGMIGEMSALYKTMTEGNAPEAAASLIGEVVAEIEASKDAKDKLKLPETKSSATQAAQLVHQLGLDLEVLDQKSTPDETRAFKDWLVEIAQATAEATKEGGFLGIGAVRVSDKEQMALATLRHELGVGSIRVTPARVRGGRTSVRNAPVCATIARDGRRPREHAPPVPGPRRDGRSVVEGSLRPRTLDEYIGQAEVKSNLSVLLQAAKGRGEAADHILLYGPPGLGKTTLATIVARELGVNVRYTSGPAIERAGDLAAILTSLDDRDVLFIDEIHRLNRAVEEILYPAMEDFALDVMIGKGPSRAQPSAQPEAVHRGRRDDACGPHQLAAA